MRRDFHFYGLAVIARAAGFGSREALTLAGASQYVDDATESELLTLTDGEQEFQFDPVRTAYDYAIQSAWRNWPAQKRVLLPFHFLPPEPFGNRDAGPFAYITRPDSAFARAVVERAVHETDRRRRLCALGIALHTYADTWAHQGFSGRVAPGENDVENIRPKNPKTGAWEHPLLENIIYDALPQIGHAEAGLYPDLGGETFRFDLSGQKDIERDNPAEFMTAADRIYDLLAAIPDKSQAPGEPKAPEWTELRLRVAEMLAYRPKISREFWQAINLESLHGYFDAHLDEICQEWRWQFGGLFDPADGLVYDYDPQTWRNQALQGDTDWRHWTGEDWLGRMPLAIQPDFWDSPWVHFHRAALRQRHFVIERLP